MKKGIRGHDVEATGLKNIVQRCKEQGIEYLQLVLERSIDGFQYGQYSKEYAESIKAELGDLKIAVLGSYINPSDPDEGSLRAGIDKFKEKIKYAATLNPIVVGTETGMYNGQPHTEEAYQYLLKTVKELVSEGEKYGVNIGIEGVHLFVINSPQIMARLINDVNSENLKVIFDPCNLLNAENYQNQDQIISDMFELVGEKITVLHAKDFVIEDGKMRLAAPGEGMLNYKLIFEKMKEYNLDIPVICEEIDDKSAKVAFLDLEAFVR